MERTDLQDTSDEAWRILRDRLRELTPEEKARMLSDRIESARDLRKRTEHLRREKSETE